MNKDALDAARQVKELAEAMAAGPWCPSFTSTQVRHVVRNCDLECGTHSYSDDSCKSFGRYDGEAIAWVRTLAPLIAQALIDAEAVIAICRDNPRDEDAEEIWLQTMCAEAAVERAEAAEARATAAEQERDALKAVIAEIRALCNDKYEDADILSDDILAILDRKEQTNA